MPKIRAGFPFKLDGKQVNIGDELNVDDETARRKVSDGHAQLVGEDKKSSDSAEVEQSTATPTAAAATGPVENVTSTSTTTTESSTPSTDGGSGRAQKAGKGA